MNIRKLILEGEGVTQDFKKRIASCEKIAKTMVSFANNKGGRLLVGIADDGTKYKRINYIYEIYKTRAEALFEQEKSNYKNINNPEGFG